MKTRIRIALGALVGIALFVVALPISSAAPPSPVSVVACSQDQERGERRHVRQGPEVGKRVRQLRKYNKNVQRALADFERNEKRNGHKPRIDDAESFTIDPAGGTAALNMATSTPFRKASYKPQDFSGYGLETIVITTYEAPGEWQGTVIFNKFDPVEATWASMLQT
jgi:hypothetical protein